MDPINMAEGLFAVANIFSFSRICFLLPANQQLGPLQISLGNMISVS
jgi:transient receptor potential cation channel subfamily C member 4